jgi:hypothetical protein
MAEAVLQRLAMQVLLKHWGFPGEPSSSAPAEWESAFGLPALASSLSPISVEPPALSTPQTFTLTVPAASVPAAFSATVSGQKRVAPANIDDILLVIAYSTN